MRRCSEDGGAVAESQDVIVQHCKHTTTTCYAAQKRKVPLEKMAEPSFQYCSDGEFEAPSETGIDVLPIQAFRHKLDSIVAILRNLLISGSGRKIKGGQM